MRLVLFSVLICSLSASAQDLVEYSEDFVFEGGIYLSFEDFKNNNPIPPTHLISDFDIRNPNYLDRIVGQDTIWYYDNLFEERTVTTNDIWGFSKGESIYINHDVNWHRKSKPKVFGFYRITEVGALCYYSADQMVYTTTVNLGLIGTNLTEEPIYMIIDFKTGKLTGSSRGVTSSFDPYDIYPLLAPDRTLLKKYSSLSFRQQKKQAMSYIMNFNKHNSISFPVNSGTR